jgi:hypothetical protein
MVHELLSDSLRHELKKLNGFGNVADGSFESYCFEASSRTACDEGQDPTRSLFVDLRSHVPAAGLR